MQDPVAKLVRQGRQLPPADRERLVDGLLESLAEYDSGAVQAVDAEVVFARARKIAGT